MMAVISWALYTIEEVGRLIEVRFYYIILCCIVLYRTMAVISWAHCMIKEVGHLIEDII
jgi:hypothetical protein